MLLTIDCGNTNTVFAISKNSKIFFQWRINTNKDRTADEYSVWLLKLMELENLNLSVIKNCIIATVVPDALFSIKLFCEKFISKNVLVVGDKGVSLGINVNIDYPEEAGADRLVNAVAVNKYYETPSIVIDFGTATTIDIIGDKGSYEGGVIAPGVNLSLEALYMAASRLPRIAIEPWDKKKLITGRNTKDSMSSGIYWGYVSLIEGLVERLSKEHNRKFFVIATGGLAKLFFENCNVINKIDNDLTILGLMHIYEINQES